jgi:hypothetical protein
MLKLFFIGYILHLLQYIKTHATKCFAIILNILVIFFTSIELSIYMSWIIHFEPID